MKNVAIIDYGMSNIDSVARAVEECGGRPVVTNRLEEIESSQYIILPGVGTFFDAMAQLKKYSLDAILSEQVIDKQIPFLGICLGMQLMAKTGLEGGEIEGLGLIDGVVKRLRPDSVNTRIPHIGWNEVDFVKKSPILEGIDSGKDFYFVHSYHFEVDEKNVIARTPYCGGFNSIVFNKLAFGVQFHPEKSQKFGLKLLKNFISI